MDGLAEDNFNFDALKENFLDLLDSDDSSLKELGKVLRIDIMRYATVRDLITHYEHRFGMLSLKKWEYILRKLGYLEFFQQHVAADQMVDATDIDDLNDDQPSLAATKQWPRSGSGTSPLRRLTDGNQLQRQHDSSSKEFGPKDNKELKKSARQTKRTVDSKVLDKRNQTTGEWPEWSLPPPENFKKESTVEESAIQGNDGDDSTVGAVSTESGFFSGEDTLHKDSITLSNVQSLVPANSSPLCLLPETHEKETSQCENTVTAEVERREDAPAASPLCADFGPQTNKIRIPSRPTTPEAPRLSHNPLVTGLRSCQDNPVVGAHLPLRRDEQHGNNNGNEQISGNPAEHYDDTENDGLLTELQKENESLHLSVSYLVEELREKDLLCTNVRTLCRQLQQQLEESRGLCARLQQTVQELERRLREGTVLEEESQRLIRMSHELCLWREQECERLKEHIRQMDQRHDTANCRMENLNRENQEMSEELHSAVGEMRNLLQEREQNLAAEHERLRLDSERQLEERMAEMTLAFANAETDNFKKLKQELTAEKCRRRETEERNKALLKENLRLQALVRQLRSPSGGSCEGDEQEDHESINAASSESEADEQTGSVNSSQQSDYDSSDDEVFEDARDVFELQPTMNSSQQSDSDSSDDEVFEDARDVFDST